MADGSTDIRVVLVDDHTIVRQGLVALLAGCSDIRIVGEASDGTEALEQIAQTNPHVVVMDISLPRLNGIDVTQQVTQRYPGVRVVMLSMHSGEEYVRPAVRAGARGYLVKGSGLSDLTTAIRAVAVGDAFFSPTVAGVLLGTNGAKKAQEALSGREREILRLVAEGNSSPEISSALGISVKTVEGHRHRIMSKLGAANVVGLVHHAIRLGLINVE